MSCWANFLEGFCKRKSHESFRGQRLEEAGAGITWLTAHRRMMVGQVEERSEDGQTVCQCRYQFLPSNHFLEISKG